MSRIAVPHGHRNGIVVRPWRALAALLLASGLLAACQDMPVTGPRATDPLAGTAPAHPIGSFRLPVVNAAPATISSQFLVTPTGLEFGNVPVGAASPVQSVTVTNIGTATAAVNIGGGGAGVFGGATNCTIGSLDVGESCRIDYRFTPTATGPAAVTATIFLNGESFPVDLTGTGVAPSIVLTPSALDFGAVQVGTKAPDQSMTLTNTGTTTVTLNLAGGAAGDFGGASGCGSTLAPGASCSIFYAFKPTATGPATMTSTLFVAGVPHTLDFAGTGVDLVKVTPTRLDFGEVEVRVKAPTQAVILTNTGTTTVPVSLAGGGAGVFGGVNGCGSTLAAGASCAISYAFEPTVTGPASTTATLSVNGMPHALEFTGTGIAAGSTPLYPILVTPSRMDFGAVQVGATAPSQSVTLKNTGTSAVSLNLAGGGAGVFGGANGCLGTLQPGQSCTISYAFRPTAAGPATQTATLFVAGVGHVLDFVGTGIDFVRVSPTRFEFGEVPVGTTAPKQSVTLTNTGPTTAPVNLAGGGAGVFGGANGCSGTLLSGQSCTISYAFRPTAAGPATQTATLFVNNGPHPLDFSGTGVGDEFLVTPTGLNFGNIDVGQTSPSQEATITNAGLSTVTLTFAGGGVSPPFNAAQSCAGATLDPGESCKVVYEFAPTTTGLATATSNFTVNGNPFSVELTGFGFGDTEGPVADPVDISPEPAEVGSAVTLTATIDDQATGNSDIASAEYSIDGETWTPMSAADQAFDTPVENVTATFDAPAVAGIHDVCVRGTDTAGNTGTPGCTMLSVFDPDGGFATGAGWFHSKPGAFPDEPNLTGRAVFAFVARYRPGSTTLNGNTRLLFKVAALGFRSTAYDYLIVDPSGTSALIRGTGLINGWGAPNATPFHFLLQAGDGHPDTFHIRIWWVDAGQERTIYDNAFDQPLNGGAIVIHN